MVKRIAIDARVLSKSTGTYVRFLLKHLQQLPTDDLQFDVLLREQDLNKWHPTKENFTVKVADYKDFTFREQVPFARQLNNENYDLVHFCMQQQPVLYNRPKITTFHDLTLLRWRNESKNPIVFRAKQLVARAAFYRAIRSADHIITPSRYSAEDVVKFAKIPRDKVTVTYLAAEPEYSISETIEVPSPRFILYVGNFFSYKNVQVIGAAIQRLLGTHPDLHAVLVGRLDGSAEVLKARFEQRGYRNIYFTGYIPDPQRDWLYEHAAAYVFPSLMEGFGLPGLEAMVHGAPVIAADATCLPEIYQNAAEYFDPSNAESLAEAIIRVVDSPQRGADLRRQGQKLLESYSWRHTAEQTLEVYRSVLSTTGIS